MDQRDQMAYQLVGRVQYFRNRKLTCKEARDAIAELVQHADAVMAAGHPADAAPPLLSPSPN